MRSLLDIKASTNSIEELWQDIDDRSKLICQMVGNLYPSVLAGEIQEIRGMICKLQELKLVQ